MLGLSFVLAISATLVVLRVRFNGAPLASDIANVLNKRMRGRLDVGAVNWKLSGLRDAVDGGWVPLEIHDVTLWDDSEPRQQLLNTKLITLEIDLHALATGDHSFVFRNVTLHGGTVKLIQTTEPYPLHDYDRTIVSLLSAFYPKARPVFRAGISAGTPPPIFDLSDIHLRNLDIDLLLKPYAGKFGRAYHAALGLRDLSGDGQLYMDPTDPVVSRLYFAVSPEAKHASFEINKDGDTSKYRFDMDKFHVNRLAQLPQQWPRNFVANTLELDISAHTVQGADLNVKGEIINYWDRPYDGAWSIAVEASKLGATLHDIVSPALHGDDVSARIALTGPYIASPKISWEVHGLDVDIPIKPGAPPLQLALEKVRGALDLVNDQGSIDKSTARVIGAGVGADDKTAGEIELSATFGIVPYNLNASLQIEKPIDIAPWLPARVSALLGHEVSGHLHATGDGTTSLQLDGIDLAMGHTPHDTTTKIHNGRVVASGGFTRIDILRGDDKRALTVESGGSTASATGNVGIKARTLSIDATASSSDLDHWFRAFGAPPLARSATDVSIKARGSWASPTVTVHGRVHGVGGADNVEVGASMHDGVVDVTQFDTSSLGGHVKATGQFSMSRPQGNGRIAIDASGVDIARIPGLAKIPGVHGTIASAHLTTDGPLSSFARPRDLLAMAHGYVQSDDLRVMGEQLDHVAMCVNQTRAQDDTMCRRHPHDDAAATSSSTTTAQLDPVAVPELALSSCADAKRSGGVCLVGTATRHGGGTADVTVSNARPRRGEAVGGGGALGGQIDLGDIPLSILARVLGVPGGFGGTLSSTIALGGTANKPAPVGTIELLRTWAVGALLGDAALHIEHDAKQPNLITISGSALADRVAITARIDTAPPYAIDLSLRGKRIELDPFVNIGAALGLSDPVIAWASGSVTLHAELGSPHVEPVAWIELDELSVQYDRRDSDGRPMPMALSVLGSDDTRTALSIRATPSSVALVCRPTPKQIASASEATVEPCPVRIATPAGVVTVGGTASKSSIDLAAEGSLDFSLLQPMLSTRFDDIAGTADLQASLVGAIRAPTITADLTLHDVRVRPVGQETVVHAPSGLIKLSNGSLGFSDVRVRVDDTDLGENAELVIKGGVGMHGLRPTSWGVIVEGQIAGKMLLVAAPALFSQASGVATIEDSITLSGTGTWPDVSGSVRFDVVQPLAVVPRGFRRELAISGGTLAIADGGSDADHRRYSIEADDVSGSIDGEGKLNSIHGSATIENWGLADADISLTAVGLPFRVPRKLDLVLNADTLRIHRASAQSPWNVDGSLVVVDGRYVENIDFNYFLDSIKTEAPSTPFWETYPELGGAALDLELDVRHFSVADNIAKIDMAGSLVITGTPKEPRLEGAIDVQRGIFQLPLTRAQFTRTSGNVTFSPQARFPSETPTLQITSEADYIDTTGQTHLITLTLAGVYRHPTWDLFTSTGFDKAQTMNLLVAGRTAEQLRRSLGDEAIGNDPTRIDPTTNPTGGATDQILKDVTGDWISSLVGDQLKELTHLDVFRVLFGVGSWSAHGEEKILENFNLIGEFEQTIRGRTINVHGEFRTPYKINLQGGYLDKSYNDQIENDISDWQAKLVYRWFLP